MGEVHRLSNNGKIPVVLIEAQVGEYTGEDDIVRLDDDFKRI
jgi:mannose-1-phosphate guanylyltransferase